MNKIMKVAFTAMYPSMNIDTLLEVINATRNPVIAAEKLLGIYEEPVLLMYWRPENPEKSRKLIGFSWNVVERDQVEYEYQSKETTTRYLGPDALTVFDAGFDTDSEAVSFLNKHGKYSPDGDNEYERRKTVIAIHTNSCSVEEWKKWHSAE
jgi:hypothetical protein